MLTSRRALAVFVTAALTAGAVALSAQVWAAPGPAAPTTVPTFVHPICRLRGQLPAPLWQWLVRVLHADCRTLPPRTPPTNTTTLLGDGFGIEGYLLHQACEGTPAVPVDCREGVPTPGRVRINDEVLETSADGFYQRYGVGRAAVQGVIDVPPNRIADCPVVVTSGSIGGPNNRFDPICRSFPVPVGDGHEHGR